MPGIDPIAVERRVHDAVNNVRAVRGLSPLSVDDDLRAIARSHSRDMARRGYVGHSTPTGTDMGRRYERFDYDCRVPVDGGERYIGGGENVARLPVRNPVRRSDGRVVVYESMGDLAHGVVWGWMHSPGHRENLLRSCWQQEGIGVVVEDDEAFITQNFC